MRNGRESRAMQKRFEQRAKSQQKAGLELFAVNFWERCKCGQCGLERARVMRERAEQKLPRPNEKAK